MVRISLDFGPTHCYAKKGDQIRLSLLHFTKDCL